MSLRDAIYKLMKDGKQRTLFDIRAVTGGSDSGISAKLRDLRKFAHGGHTLEVEAPYRIGGPYTYRLIVNPAAAPKPCNPPAKLPAVDLFENQPDPPRAGWGRG